MFVDTVREMRTLSFTPEEVVARSFVTAIVIGTLTLVDCQWNIKFWHVVVFPGWRNWNDGPLGDGEGFEVVEESEVDAEEDRDSASSSLPLPSSPSPCLARVGPARYSSAAKASTAGEVRILNCAYNAVRRAS